MKYTFVRLLLFLVLLTPLSLYSQDANVDSLQQVYKSSSNPEQRVKAALSLSSHYRETDSVQTFLWLGRALNLARPTAPSFLAMKAFASSYKSKAAWGMKDKLADADSLIRAIPDGIDSAEVYYLTSFVEVLEGESYYYTARRMAKTALKKLPKDQPTLEARLLLVEAFAETQLGNHAQALTSARRAQKLGTESGSLFLQGYSLDLLGTIMQNSNKDEQAAETYKQVIQFALDHKFWSNAFFSVTSLAGVYAELSKIKPQYLDSLYSVYIQGEELYEKCQKHIEHKVPYFMILVAKAQYLNSSKRYPETLATYDQILRIKELSPYECSIYKFNRAVCLNDMLQFSQALQSFQSQYNELQETKSENLGQFISLTDIIHQLYAELKQPAKAYEYAVLNKLYSDSLHARNDKKRSEELFFEYEAEQKDHQIALMAEQEKAQDALVARRNWQIAAAAGVLLLALLIAYILYRTSLRRRRDNETLSQQNAEIQQQKEEIRVQSEEIQGQRDNLQQANEKLLELDQFKDGMIGMVAHDLKNPLNAVLALSSLNPQDKNSQIIRKAGQRMLILVQNMLDVQKYEETEIQLHPQPVLVSQLTEDAIEQVEMLLSDKRQSIDLKCDPNCAVSADRALIVRVLVNLLTNANKYAPLGDTIQIAARTLETDLTEITLTDHGEGIPADKLQSVFDRFGQVVARSSGKAASTGLGLTFCKLVIEAHGGTIAVESQVGKYTTFRFTLPAATVDDAAVSFTTKKSKANFVLSSEEKKAISSVQAELLKLPLYDLSAIVAVLDGIRNKSSQIDQWADQVEQAAFMSDKEAYDATVKEVSAPSTN